MLTKVQDPGPTLKVRNNFISWSWNCFLYVVIFTSILQIDQREKKYHCQFLSCLLIGNSVDTCVWPESQSWTYVVNYDGGSRDCSIIQTLPLKVLNQS